ncbi:MAG: hypothetical protein NT031_05835, partial [Planctomycetota bacterium]|nr:hypothetical protein [Planctomycetota bacterium]
MTAVISETTLETLRQRRTAGESFKTLAQEAGIPWQRLWGLLLGPMEKGPMLRVNPKAGSLTEKYRPTSLDSIWGQQRVVDFLKRYAAHPYP